MTSVQSAVEPTHQALEQAAEWFALLRSGEATPDERRRWQSWLERAQENRTAWGYVERISSQFQPVQSSPGRDAAAKGYCMANSRMARRRQMLFGLAALAGTGLSGLAAWRLTPLPGVVLAWAADHRSATGEVRQIELADGSVVWLGTGSAFDEDYSGGLRRLRLLAGEILIQTAADPARPFVVDTPQGRVRALGTRFTVRLDGDETLVAVYKGAVEARTAFTGSTRVIQTGEQTRFTDAALAATQSADPAREAWSRGILVTNNTPLADVASELQRYRGGVLRVAPEIANLPVIGSYPATDPDRALAMLEGVLPIRIQRTLPWWVSIQPRGGPVGSR
ncbi:FecR domain-containing protein [Achromobacter animicus]|uniref:FecR domain-containing protein n=1 Tax=Achromobacter animicus TaxID=1389935 RepID=UPI002448C65E|nr:FecR domain-containing protein [Achromobacter animicus]MDH0683319.1 FecR domain-containing protein [Achromobacter animicus]